MNHNGTDVAYIEKLLKNYGDLKGELHLVEFSREPSASLGLSLAGNRDLATMSVFVVGLQPGSVAAGSGLVQVGDELLEINGLVLYGRSHLNASAIIKTITSLHVRIVLLRSEDFSERTAVGPLRLPPVTYKDSSHTLIPKKPKSLSLDDAAIQDELNRQRNPEISTLSSRESRDEGAIEQLSNKTATHDHASVICSQQQEEDVSQRKIDELTPSDATSPTPENESTPAPVCRPSSAPASIQGKGRRLQKSAQVEEMEEEMTTAKEAGGGGGGGGEETGTRTGEQNGSSHTGSPLRQQDATFVDVEISNADPGWNRFPVEEISPETSTNSSSPLHPSVDTILEDSVTCGIVSGRSNTIEIRKGKVGLGLKIIGGSDTILKAIIVYEIYKNGAAAKDGRLWPGDQILEVNGLDLREVTHNRAVQILRQVATTVRMVVYRDESIFRDDEMYDAITVELMKKPGKGLGLSIISRRDNSGILISDIVKGGVADADGRLLPGDQILAVNGDDVRTATQDHAAELLKTSMGKIVLQIGRLKVTSKSNSSRSSSGSQNSRGILKSESNASDCKNTGRRTPKRIEMACRSVIPCLQSQD